MNKNIISLLILLTSAFGLNTLVVAQSSQIKSDAPDRYTVERGDTLWGISGRFLERPWNWPQL
jgi:nucleoid-associated protein YgaU